MKYGEVRKANLRLLIQYAQEYEAGGQKGIAGFLRFVDKMISRGEDWSCASSVTDRSDAVRIMSVHHSKGLEFPVVFLCDTSKRFNTQDLRSNMLLHSQLGFACCARDFVTRKQYPTVPMEALKLELQRSMLSEEMRILYVALTRAKEKLIITSVQNDLEKKLSGYVNALTERGTVSPYVARSASSYADWILMSLVFHPDFTRLCIDLGCMPEDVITLPACRFRPVLAEIHDQQEEQAGEPLTFSEEPQQPLVEQIRALCSDSYPDRQAREIVTKLSVSQVVHHGEGGFSEVPFSKEPAFLKEEGALSGAQRGTALHTFMSCADHAHAQQDLEGEIERMTHEHYLTAQEAQSLDRRAISRYYQSDLFLRSQRSNNLRREFAFQMELGREDLETVIPNIGEHLVTVQGIADMIFEEDGAWVLADFKTDRVDADVLCDRYRRQLALYAKMIAGSTGMPVREKVIYSFYLGRALTLS